MWSHWAGLFWLARVCSFRRISRIRFRMACLRVSGCMALAQLPRSMATDARKRCRGTAELSVRSGELVRTRSAVVALGHYLRRLCGRRVRWLTWQAD